MIPANYSNDTQADIYLIGASIDPFAADYADSRIPAHAVSYGVWKRAFDFTFSFFMLCLLSPIMLLIALAVKLTSPGPVFFRQVRVGRRGKHFRLIKFRSMCVNAEALRKEIEHLNEADGPVFKIKRDPRITPVGAFLRKYSLDELPQFINVLVGQMSVVGPRPPLPLEVEQYGERELRRLSVKPGLTCLWQICGRNDVNFDQWMEMDIQYLNTMSFQEDLRIVLKTIPAVLTGRGAQ